MAARSRRLGLTWAIFGTFALALFALVFGLFMVLPQQAQGPLEDTLFDRGKGVAREIERKIVEKEGFTAVIGARDGIDQDASNEIRTIIGGEDEIRSAWVLVCPDAECSPRDLIAIKPNTNPELTRAVIEAFNAGNRRTRLLLDPGDLLVSDEVRLRAGSGRAHVLVLLDTVRVREAIGSLRRTLLVALLISVVFFIAVVGVLSRALIIGPIRQMRGQALRLSEADLSGRVEGASTRELQDLAEALNMIGQGLRDTIGRVRGVAESVAQVIDSISRTAATTTGGSATVLTRVEETSSAMVEMLASLKGIAENVETLYGSAEDSSSSILEMATTNDEVAENVMKMAASVEQTTSAIEQTTYSIKEVARNVEDLLKSAELTSSSIREMDVAISQVETNAYETARLSEQVSKDAELGAESIQKTIVGIDKIKDSSRAASTVIEHLGRRILEIGNIVDVIDEVAEQTNLLALNAAIIAAQAGEHGKGFAVVAEEIKDLAERTGASTKEIGDLIRAVQDESRNAVTAMNQGVRHVEDGVLLGRETEGALKKIQDSANRSTQMVKAIARATVEQAKGSKDVTVAVDRIRETVEQISKATNEQARGSEQIMKSAEHMKMLTTHVTRSVQEQAHGSKQISRSIENINEMVTHLNRAQKEQTRGSEQVLKAIETIKSVSEQQNRSVKQLEEAIETLRQQGEVLRGEIRRFRV